MEDTDENVISVEALTKRYDDLTAVDGISFSVRRGEVFGILGPNGAGKTTTLECIEGIQSATSGNISVLGMDIAEDAERIKRRIGVQLQASAYFDHLTLREIVDLFASMYGATPPDDLLASVGLEDRANTTVAKLSGGQQQRFTIAAALVNDPDVAFLDEPTAGLDPQARRNLWDFVQTINARGRTVVITTHYMEEAEFLCDRVAIMDKGKIVALDTPAGLIRSLEAPYEISVALDGEWPAGEPAGLPSVTETTLAEDGRFTLRSSDSAATIQALADRASSEGVKVRRLEVRHASLEDVFLSLTGREFRE